MTDSTPRASHGDALFSVATDAAADLAARESDSTPTTSFPSLPSPITDGTSPTDSPSARHATAASTLTLDKSEIPAHLLRFFRPASVRKPKDDLMIPHRVYDALMDDGWYGRMDICWSKPSPMPESVTDRPTRSHEYLFLLSKGPRYFYDADAIREDGKDWSSGGPGVGITPTRHYHPENGGNEGLSSLAARYKAGDQAAGRNKRSVWTIPTTPFSSERLGLGETEHFAVFPSKLVEPCVLAGSAARACGVCGAPWRRVTQTTANGQGIECPKDDAAWAERPAAGAIATSRLHGQYHDVERRTVGWEPSCAHDDDTGRSVVLDPFAGSGTVGVVCGWHGRDFIGIELSAANGRLAEKRIALEGRPASGGKPKGHKPTKVSPDQDSLFG